ncbi:MAG TPA: PLP-dependent aminotransferase family protein, partial [Limnochordia bacterium]|nr:PLP-dependent aminotransferase family protein [Limnochordia bacterium]
MAQWEQLLAKRTEKMKASDIRDAFRLSEQSDIISFAGGFPSPETFPAEAVADAARAVALNDAVSAFQYGPTEGFLELRQILARNMARQGVTTGPDGILITNGSQQALDLLAKLFINPGDPVIVELPGYIGGIGALTNYEAEPMGVPIDQDGMRVDRLVQMLEERRARGLSMPKLAYLVPNFQNPSGVSLSTERRLALLAAAERFGFLIIEDNPYGEIRFEGEALPHLASLDRSGHVLYMGSFSKQFLPGVRLGWLVGDPKLIQKLVVAKQATDLCTNSFGQRLVIECERRDLLDAHIPVLAAIYRRKRDAMLAALAAHFPAGVHWTKPKGGFFIFVTLPAGLDAKKLLPDAVAEEHVAYVSGGAFFVDGSG